MSLLPRTAPDLVALALSCVVAWSWDVAVQAWDLAPAHAAATLSADTRVLHPEDLPGGAVRVLEDARDPRTFLAEELVAIDTPLPASVERLVIERVIDRRIDEDTQLLLLLNTAPVGDVVGLDTAARRYFGKRCEELDLDEFTVLVTMIGRPAVEPMS